MIDEPGTEEAQRAYSDTNAVRVSAIAHVEAVAAIARMHKGGRLTTPQLRRGLDGLESLWRGVYVHAVSEAILSKAAESALNHSLRAYDAVHLAAALSFAVGEALEFACWDKELRDAAHKHGFALIPQQL